MPISIPARRARLEAATKMPWDYVHAVVYLPQQNVGETNSLNSPFIVGMANEESELLEELERLEKENEELKNPTLREKVLRDAIKNVELKLSETMLDYIKERKINNDHRTRETAYRAFKEAVEKMGPTHKRDYYPESMGILNEHWADERDATLKLCPKDE